MAIKILAIDDDPAITELLGLLLRGYGLEMIPANDGQLGLDLARSEKPDLILLDLMMPDVDGWQVCKMVRSFSKKVPIIIISALDDPAIISSTLDAGADDYLVKPVPGSKLIEHINNLIRRA